MESPSETTAPNWYSSEMASPGDDIPSPVEPPARLASVPPVAGYDPGRTGAASQLAEMRAELDRLRQRVERPRGRRASLVGLGVVIGALVVIPALVVAEPVPHLDPVEDFEGAISGTKMQENFANIDQRLATLEAVFKSASSGSFTQGGLVGDANSLPFEAVPGLELDGIEVDGGAVRLELAPASAEESYAFVAAPSPRNVRLYVRFERSVADADQWSTVALVRYGGGTDIGNGDVADQAPPGVFNATDSPPAGTYDYRVVAATSVNSGGEATNGGLQHVALLVSRTSAVEL